MKELFSKKWILATLLVVVGVGVLVRLGLWQLDRLNERRAYNMMVAERWQQEPFDLNVNPFPEALEDLEFRRVQVAGTFDFERQIALRNRPFNESIGFILMTPLLLSDGHAVLVARGWVPQANETPASWRQFDEADDQPIVGLIQASAPHNATIVASQSDPQALWFNADIQAIAQQLPYTLEPGFILQLPEEGRTWDQYPIREEPLRLDEGSHLSYSVQWFMFALILGFGYIQYVGYMNKRSARIAAIERGEIDPEAKAAPVDGNDYPSTEAPAAR